MLDAHDDVHTALVESDERGPILRLPAGLFQPGDRVRVRREEQPVAEAAPAAPETAAGGATREAADEWVPENVHPSWPPGFWEEFAKLPPVSDEFVRAVLEARQEWNRWPERIYPDDRHDPSPDGEPDAASGPPR